MGETLGEEASVNGVRACNCLFEVPKFKKLEREGERGDCKGEEMREKGVCMYVCLCVCVCMCVCVCICMRVRVRVSAFVIYLRKEKDTFEAEEDDIMLSSSR